MQGTSEEYLPKERVRASRNIVWKTRGIQSSRSEDIKFFKNLAIFN